MALRVVASKLMVDQSGMAGMRGMAGLSLKLPDLPYGYSALEPAISGAIMEVTGCQLLARRRYQKTTCGLSCLHPKRIGSSKDTQTLRLKLCM